MLFAPEVTALPAQAPTKMLKQPEEPSRAHPEQVLDANKFKSASALNPAEIPVSAEPSPQNLVALTIPVALYTVAIPARHTLKELSPDIQRFDPLPISS